MGAQPGSGCSRGRRGTGRDLANNRGATTRGSKSIARVQFYTAQFLQVRILVCVVAHQFQQLQLAGKARLEHPPTILLILRDPANADLLRTKWEENQQEFSVECVGQLSAGVERLKAGQLDAVVLDLVLPDCQGIATFER